MEQSNRPRWDPIAVAMSFGLGEVTGEATQMARGAMGLLWRLETSSGSWAIKDLFNSTTDDDLETEFAFVDAARDAGVSAPAVVRTTSGRAVLSAVGADNEPLWIRAYEWIDNVGSPPVPVPDGYCSEAGALLARLHRLSLPSQARPDDWYLQRHIGGPWRSLHQRVGSIDRELQHALGEALDELEALDALADRTAAGPWEVCHRDFDPANTLIDPTDRLWVVDWENSGSLFPVSELAYSLLNWASLRTGEPHLTAMRAFLSGYATLREIPAPDGIEVFSVGVRGRTNFIALMLLRLLDGSLSAERRDRASMLAKRVLASTPSIGDLRRFYDAWNDFVA